MAYQSLYRKYRPQRFGELIGQEHLTAALAASVREDRVGHAYLFSGPRGTGKTTAARILGKAINCLARGDDGEPCGECENCVAIAAGRFADLIELDAASNTGIDSIRDLIERVHLGVGASTVKKVYIIDEVHMLTTAASNALLKTLEEPPDHVMFALATTNPEKVLPTIRSRTQHFELSLYTTDQLVAILRNVLTHEGIEAEDEAVARIAHQGAGSARDALSLLDQTLATNPSRLDLSVVTAAFGGSPFDTRVNVLDAVAAEDPAGALGALAELLETGHEPRRLADDLLGTLRDAFVLVAADGRVRVELTEDERARLAALATHLGTARLVRALETIGHAVADMRGTDATDPRLTLEIALVRIARRDTLPQIQSLVDRVERLEEALRNGIAGVGSPGASADAAPAAPSATPKASLGELRRERAARAPALEPSTDPGPDPGDSPAPASTPASAPAASPSESTSGDASFDLDDVVVAWAAVLAGLSLAIRNAVQEAQPIAIEDDIVVFGVAPRAMERTKRRFHREAPEIRAALAAHLGANPRFRLVAQEGLEPPPTPSTDAPAPQNQSGESAESDGSEPSEPGDVVDPDELADAPPAGTTVDSLSRLQNDFGATVVDEIPQT